MSRGCWSPRSSASAAPAAARPLRTALSIVAGQPVSVHAPARKSRSTGVRGPGRSTCVPGAARNVARGSWVTATSSSPAPRADGSRRSSAGT